MAGTKVAPCTIVDSTLSKPLLLRSTSTPKSALCSCGALLHGQLPVEVVPARLFTRTPHKVHSFVQRLITGLEGVRIKTNTEFQVQKTTGTWWNVLFSNELLSPFAHMWRALIRMEQLFSSQSELCDSVKLCNVASDFCGKPSCPCRGLQLRLGSVSSIKFSGDHHLYSWAPCSNTFAIEVTMNWAKLSMEMTEKRTDLTGDANNLCHPSFGVLENWVDLLLLGQLSALATNSVQIEPESMSFFEETTCPLSPESGDSNTTQQVEAVVLKENQLDEADSVPTRPNTLTIVLEDSRDEDDIVCSDPSTDSAYWQQLSQSWQMAVEKRMCEPGTIVIDISDPNLDTLIDRLLQFCQAACARVV